MQKINLNSVRQSINILCVTVCVQGYVQKYGKS